MPTFGDYETYGEPLAITEDRGHVSTVWRARKSGNQGDPNFAVKCYAPHRRQSPEGNPEDALAKDPAQEFLAGIKQLQKAYNDGACGIVPIHDVGFSDEGAWYVTSFYPRNTLKAWIARRGGVDSAALGQVVNGIVSGCLSLKRSRGFSHGNLKASNVFLVGKPRPLRSTPLHLADAYPAAPLQLAKLGKEDRREASELLHQVMEVQDLRALGELLLQLVEGRLVTSAYDYNYPIASSLAWENLGRDGERWRDLCNRLLDPQLSLDKLSLESLAKEYKPGGMGVKLPIILGAAAILCLVGGGIFWMLNKPPSKPDANKPKPPEKITLPAKPTIVALPTITTQPLQQTVTEGGTAEFKVGVSGTTPLSYQWKRGGVNMSGETEATLTLKNVTTNQAGNYTVMVSTSAGAVTSSVARLTVNLRAETPTISMQPLEQSVTEGGTVEFKVVAGGTAPLNYQWRRDGKDLSGEVRQTLKLENVKTTQAGSYGVVVRNATGTVTSKEAKLTISEAIVKATILTQPTDVGVTEGGTAEFKVGASGTTPMSYQWKRGGVNVSGETEATLTLKNVTTNQAGNYTVMVSNSAGPATSRAAELTVNMRAVPPTITAQPSERIVTEGETATLTVTANGTPPLSYQWKRDGVNVSGGTRATLEMKAVTANQSGNYTVVVSNSGGSVTSSVAKLTVRDAIIKPTILAQPMDVGMTEGRSSEFKVTASGTEPLSYQWKRNEVNVVGETRATLVLNTVTTNQAGSYAVVVSNSAGSVTSSVAKLTVNMRAVTPTITAQPSARTVTEGETAEFKVGASGTTPMSYQWKRGGVNVSGETEATLTLKNVTTNQAGNYTVVVSNSAGLVTSRAAELTVNLRAVAPTITTQPLQQTVTEGAPATFTVTASGTTPFTYHWKRDGVNVSGGTRATLEMNPVTTNQAGNYTVMVSNSGGAVSSSVAKLTVNPPVRAVSPPEVQVEAGKLVNITLKGSGPSGVKLIYKVETQPKLGKLGNLGENLVYTANENAIGQDSFEFTASDSDGLKRSPRETVTISITESAERKGARMSLDQRLKELEDELYQIKDDFIVENKAIGFVNEVIELEKQYTQNGWLIPDRKSRIDKIIKLVPLRPYFKDAARKAGK